MKSVFNLIARGARRRRSSFYGAWVIPLGALLAGSGLVSAQQDTSHYRVLFVHTFGPDFAPWDVFTPAVRDELNRLSPRPVEFFEASLETARFAQTHIDVPLAEYLGALFEESGIDLIVAIGGSAARFSLDQRERLFPSTPLLVAGVEERALATLPPRDDRAEIAVVIDFRAAMDNIFRLLPDTTDVVVVMGGSSLELLWIDVLRRELAAYEERARFTWLHELSLRELEDRVSALPPHTAVFYGLLAVDSAGVPHEHDRALDRLRSVSSAPIFGLFDSQLGRGIVGGPLVPVTQASHHAAATMLRLLNGETAASIESEHLVQSAPIYDFRELERWRIPESRVPAGSTILLRPASWLEQYKEPLILGTSLVGLESLLIVGLLVQRARRRRAEDEAVALSRRLITAHEDERGRLARELHDDVSQRLVRLVIDTAQVEKLLASSPDEGFARAMREDAARLSQDVHALSYRLHPSVLRDLGLTEALESECELFSRRESVHAELTSTSATLDLPPDRALCLFRIAQEALRNVARHARASRVEVTLSRLHRGVQMEVKDDGVGFVAERRAVRASLGHASMRERARLAHGTLEIRSAPGEGTTVVAWVPESADTEESS